MHRLFSHSLAPNKTYLPTSHRLTFPYTSSVIKASTAKDMFQVSDQLDEFLEKCVYKEKRITFKLLREIEKKNFLNEIEKKEKDHKIEIANKDKELAIKIGRLNLNYLRLKGAIHLKGVFEQWELFHLSSFEGNRETKWTKYLSEHKVVLDIFRNYWSQPSKIDISHVVTEIKCFHKWLSERIHDAHVVGDYVEWHQDTLTPVRNKISKYICKDLNIEYRIVGEEIETTTGEVTQTNTITGDV
ncbi:hypothetical protein RclHR1_00460018 [Rhizophagus clarus]|uniref:Uncharacterized protein n=1 Tax=Rhizophagus clarus TaxID=94130 RepID=A0A2Z6RZR7_9GLOM|nr:hypothetical protein RclHR1_00460018 [Rhizophagus clarus]GES73216.1 hypothetical protein GLOIN_2v1572576 [Rhizophagus clarus]